MALVPVGAVGGGAAWCAPERAAEVAAVLAEAPGVDLAFGVEEGGCVVHAVRDRRLRARIRWDEGGYRYLAEDGDPLGLEGTLDTTGAHLVDEVALLDRTWDHAYPVAAARVRRGLTDLVRWPAPVLFSMADGHTFGPPIVDLAARLRGGQVGTHGGLSRAQSLGFVASTEPVEGGPVRAEDVFLPWQDLVRAGAAGRPPR